ncbi:phosphotransferase [Streptomyces sp. NPDC002577]
MTEAIAGRHPGAVVRDVDVLMREDGNNRRARLGLTYAAGSGPETVFVKAHDPAHRLIHLRNGNLFGEARLVTSGVALPIEHPFVYRAVVDRLRLDYLLVMEDVVARGADPRDATRPMSIDEVAHGVRGLARLHSRYWGLSRRTHPEFRWVKSWKPTKGWQAGLSKRVPIGLERAAGRLPVEVTTCDADDIVGMWARYVSTLGKGPMTLLHGDAHIGNTYVMPDGDVGFLDWQVVRRGGWSQDLGYFLVGALTEDDRRSSEAELVEEYRRVLDVPGSQRPTAEEAWLRYRAAPAFGLAIWLSTLGADGFQRHDVSLALAERYASAFAELATTAALVSLGA